MHRLGLVCVGTLSSMDDSVQRRAKLEKFSANQYRLVYVSPERLQIKDFASRLNRDIEQMPIRALVIDEAHCASEWGHDFRPAYLRIGGIRRMLEKATKRHIPVIALTATASEPVRRDIVDVLGLSRENTVQLRSSDRANLSLSVHPTQAGNTEKPDIVANLIKQVLPRALKIPLSELLPPVGQDTYDNAGIVFAMYANPHGRSTYDAGVHFIAKKLQQSVVPDEKMVRIHASTPPQLCPRCKSPLYVRLSKKGQLQYAPNAYQCTACGANFDAPLTYQGWDQEILAQQDAFKDNSFPLLVATKGFGMGVDKPNIRFVVHHAMSSGLEGYYQEAGRAGRDGEHAHAALVYQPPAVACEEEHLLARHKPPCVSDPRNLKYRDCPYGITGLCDYGKQAVLIEQSYPGIEQTVQDIVEVYLKLAEAKAALITTRESQQLVFQKSLHRLQQLGVVRGFTVEYLARKQIRFHVDRETDWTATKVAENLKAYLIKTGINAENADADVKVIAEHQEADNRDGSNIDGNHIDANDTENRAQIISKAATILISRIYEVVPNMRYDMLLNQLRYATSEKRKICRRLEVRAIFDDADTVPTEDYRCGFCDVCVPDLNFAVNEAKVPISDAQVNDIARNLSELLADFDVVGLEQVLQTATDKGGVPGLFARVSSRLEQDATSVTTRFLAGALARRLSSFEKLAFEHLHLAFTEAKRQGFTQDKLLLIYREASYLQPKNAFGWLSEVGGPLDSPSGLKYLEEEAANLFGAQSETRYNLGALYEIRSLSDLCRTVEGLQPLTSDLLRSFALARNQENL